ncbi:hypothetical protein [Rhodococcoides corynebacterioides]|uniref:hypothetical protein n=1 Tax=Rhodococcoides corynebacterioides TaxID=53972 RepID=UPI003AECA7ED
MPDHDVRLSTKNFNVRGIDLEFTVKLDAAVLGTLAVSEGGLACRPKGKQWTVPITWFEFAEWAES